MSMKNCCLDVELYLVTCLVDVGIPLEEEPHHLYVTAKQRCFLGGISALNMMHHIVYFRVENDCSGLDSN